MAQRIAFCVVRSIFIYQVFSTSNNTSHGYCFSNILFFFITNNKLVLSLIYLNYYPMNVVSVIADYPGPIDIQCLAWPGESRPHYFQLFSLVRPNLV